MNIKASSRVLFMGLSSLFAVQSVEADVAAMDVQSVLWAERTYVAILPEPFGTTTVTVVSKSGSDTFDLSITTQDGQRIDIGDAANGIKNVRDVVMSYKISDQSDSRETSAFSLKVEYGFPVRRQAEVTEDCSKDCLRWYEQIMDITVSSDLVVSRQEMYLPLE